MPAIQTTPNPSATILIVEDDQSMLDGMNDLLEITELGYDITVLQAKNGIKALEVIAKQIPNLIISDVMMPQMGGYEFLSHVRTNPEWTHIPFIFVTAKGEEPDIYKGRLSDADLFITKPFVISKLLKRIKEALDYDRLSFGIEQGTASQQEYIEILETSLGVLRSRLKKTLIDRSVLFQEYSNLEMAHKSLLNEHKALLKHQNRSLIGKFWNHLRTALRKKSLISAQKAILIQNQNPAQEFGYLTSGIVHDLRNGLGIIHNTVSFLESELVEENYKSDLAKISRSLEFSELVLRNLSTLSGRDTFQPTQINLESIIHEVFFMLERKLPDVELIMQCEPDTPTILADEGQIKQLFLNLIKNAGEAMPDGGELFIQTQREGRFLQIDLTDTGIGISPENQNRLFREYFSTKETGYGIGLHIVHTIVQHHGGRIEVKSELTKGTTFVISLPIGGQK